MTPEPSRQASIGPFGVDHDYVPASPPPVRLPSDPKYTCWSRNRLGASDPSLLLSCMYGALH